MSTEIAAIYDVLFERLYPSSTATAIEDAARAVHKLLHFEPVTPAAAYCATCGTAEHCHYPGGSRYRSCTFTPGPVQ